MRATQGDDSGKSLESCAEESLSTRAAPTSLNPSRPRSLGAAGSAASAFKLKSAALSVVLLARLRLGVRVIDRPYRSHVKGRSAARTALHTLRTPLNAVLAYNTRIDNE